MGGVEPVTEPGTAWEPPKTDLGTADGNRLNAASSTRWNRYGNRWEPPGPVWEPVPPPIGGTGPTATESDRVKSLNKSDDLDGDLSLYVQPASDPDMGLSDPFGEGRRPWLRHGECLKPGAPDLTDPEAVTEALQMCGRCAVLDPCRSWATASNVDLVGVVAGFDPSALRAARRTRRETGHPEGPPGVGGWADHV
jgi:hypothetical protein